MWAVLQIIDYKLTTICLEVIPGGKNTNCARNCRRALSEAKTKMLHDSIYKWLYNCEFKDLARNFLFLVGKYPDFLTKLKSLKCML